MKNIFLLTFIIIAVALGGVFWWSTLRPKEPKPAINQGRPGDVLPTVVNTTPSLGVPLPSETDVINLFFNLINEHRIPEAISMMSTNLVPDDNTKQGWGIHFNAIESIHVRQIEPYMENTWTGNKHIYQVTLEARVSDEAANAPIPYYGWSGNPEARWITIEKNQDKEWQIAEIATGP